MIALFTDFGLQGPYAGQMKAVLHRTGPGVPVVDLFADAPVGNPRASADEGRSRLGFRVSMDGKIHVLGGPDATGIRRKTVLTK